ncbi:AGL198Wp [Eremothecium gossypii ATCC 10895]|uniref:AGL198Wp n=1 Tax=Eremothecium gossypii (strain ATCC 10895 / CBS 109.51 / FGSC 9923 / NRRL Y-1056) TaxID=284811 RepID=Q750Y7_EREGS|nr:AGL198Wp [Eremothecium gossypii ATCC 10895]AAS54293.1 AGL198Wp [Eremothecium gossypii ATCC 10895]AEY98619.1 FAGL198Wp [Eremothecium gossypii FDAG1]
MDLVRANYAADSDSDSQGEEDVSCPLPEYISHMFRRAATAGLRLERPHVYAYADVQLSEQQRGILERLVQRANSARVEAEFQPLFYGRLRARRPLHVSLTPALQFSSAAAATACVERMRAGLAGAGVLATALERAPRVLPNCDSSVAYLALPLAPAGRAQAAALTARLGAALAATPGGLTPYDSAAFAAGAHVSVAEDSQNPGLLRYARAKDTPGAAAHLERMETLLQASDTPLPPADAAALQIVCTAVHLTLNGRLQASVALRTQLQPM